MSHHPLNFITPYINGRFVSFAKPERIFQNYNPANPNDILAQAEWCKEYIAPAIEGMKEAHTKFYLVPLAERMLLIQSLIQFLRNSADEIKSNMMLELSRSRVAVEDEWALCEKLFQGLPAFCEEKLSPKKFDSKLEWSYAPLGLVLISSNVALPMYSLLSSLLPALAAGNAVCMRPSTHCLLSSSLLVSGIHQCLFPPGIIQVVYGDFDVFRRLLLTHQFNTVYYTGGEESLEQLRRDTSIQPHVRLVLCGGGKNAAYVTKDANLEHAVRSVLLGSCLDAGQRLESTGLVFVSKQVVSEFCDMFVKSIKSMPIGAREDLSRTDAHVMEPLCSSRAWERFLRFQGIAAREADQTLRWGKAIDTPQGGFFVSPGVHMMAPEKVVQSIYASNAFFGPDVCIVPVDNDDQVIQVLNGLNATRCLSVHSHYREVVADIRRLSCVPSVLWNAPTTQLQPLIPCIGRGNAGNSYMTGAHFLLSTVYAQAVDYTHET